ncbi:SDR family oxidoreductase [Rossellomorea aquimaris]|uniref:NAD(P)-dependent oxidoreductase n=1 Tax=Rossellomorea aquimaris TaxID=189382 RepID=UPI001CD4CB0A|nr:SDR family oxidoreductase [Rossellomorea aquimaris]MCA1056512.1 SDR family oxidoreductase [Rossellomorea aquimaris]
MKLALFGSTGRVGSVVYNHAKHDHSIRRLVRRHIEPDTLATDEHVVVGDVLNEGDVSETIAGCDAVLCCLNTDKEDVLSRSMPLILKAMRQHKINRIVTCGTAGILDSRIEPHLYRFQSSEAKRRSTIAAEDHLRAFMMLQASGLDWTVVCPTYLPDGERIGVYRTSENTLPKDGRSISIYDTGDFMYKELMEPQFVRRRVGICY